LFFDSDLLGRSFVFFRIRGMLLAMLSMTGELCCSSRSVFLEFHVVSIRTI